MSVQRAQTGSRRASSLTGSDGSRQHLLAWPSSAPTGGGWLIMLRRPLHQDTKFNYEGNKYGFSGTVWIACCTGTSSGELSSRRESPILWSGLIDYRWDPCKAEKFLHTRSKTPSLLMLWRFKRNYDRCHFIINFQINKQEDGFPSMFPCLKLTQNTALQLDPVVMHKSWTIPAWCGCFVWFNTGWTSEFPLMSELLTVWSSGLLILFFF